MYNYIIDECWTYLNLHKNFHSNERKMLSENINHIVIKNVELASIYIQFFTLMIEKCWENINHCH
jgi:hypothetical protein